MDDDSIMVETESSVISVKNEETIYGTPRLMHRLLEYMAMT